MVSAILVRERLGQGAHARVYRATDGLRNADVALKIFNENALDAQQAEAVRQFQVRDNDAILELLEVHPNFAEGEVTVMPLMQRTLADVQTIFASQAVYYVTRTLTALDFCHGRGVIHGDVKPSNVFLDARGAALLGDFGVRDYLPDGARGHTLEYAAPELLQGEPRSEATDTWAAAVMLYELLTEELPFGKRAEDPDDVVAARIAAGTYRHPDNIRPYLHLRVRDFFRSAFAPDPAEREFSTADAMKTRLSNLTIRAEWIQWRREGFLTYWQGFEVRAGQRTGLEYSASVRERPRLGRWEAELKRGPAGGLRKWLGVDAYRGSQRQAVHRMVLWMQSITLNGRP